MDGLLMVMSGLGVMLLTAFLRGFFHFHSTITQDHLHGRKTWAKELQHFSSEEKRSR